MDTWLVVSGESSDSSSSSLRWGWRVRDHWWRGVLALMWKELPKIAARASASISCSSRYSSVIVLGGFFYYLFVCLFVVFCFLLDRLIGWYCAPLLYPKVECALVLLR